MRVVRLLRAFAAAALGLGLTAAGALAQSYPSKPITMVIPWPAGGSSDLTLRALGDVAAKHLGQPFIYDNKTGASGTLGPATVAAGAKPDGYTITQIPITVMRLPLMQKVSWNAEKDFSYIVHLTGYTFGITTKAGGEFKTWGDVVKYAKANPGKVTYGTPGAGTTLHIGMEQIAAKAGIKLTMVPFKGGAETNAAVLGGHTMLQADSTGWKPLVDAKELHLLTLWTPERSKNWPDVPTLQELGYPFVFDSPFGLAGPKGMDPAHVQKLHDAFKKAIEDPAVVEMMRKYDMFPRYMNSADYAKFVGQIIAQEKAALEQIGLLKKD
ncbi:MAG: tripartite tricarboxylate transporter substrate binding protein [Rhodospirillales bacterium]|nr:tripartite tricarboxylate transporter substrate binding protein [Rhodospirillales bacterium]